MYSMPTSIISVIVKPSLSIAEIIRRRGPSHRVALSRPSRQTALFNLTEPSLPLFCLSLGLGCYSLPYSYYLVSGLYHFRVIIFIRQGPRRGWEPVLSHMSLTALLITNGDADLCIRMRRRDSLTSA